MGNIDLRKIRTYPIRKRNSKVKKEDFTTLPRKNGSFSEFFNSLPKILAARDLTDIVDSIVKARKKRKPVIFMMGAHVIKCGLSPIIIDLIEKKVITLIALNGAGVVHDFEIAFIGQTSEEVDKAIENGSFGMAQETASFINKAIKDGTKKGIGIGSSVGEMIGREKLGYKELSIVYRCWKCNIPATVHVAIGTDVIHQHFSCDGASLGKGSLKDFHTFVEEVSRLGDGGVIANIGSAVILPEVFLKAISMARNVGYKVRNFTACNFDKVFQYRPSQNVVARPIAQGGKGYSVVGHHEIMIPLLYRAIIEKM